MATQEKASDGKWRLGQPVGEIKDGKFVGYLQKADENPSLAKWEDGVWKFVLKKEGDAVGEDGKPLVSEKTGKTVARRAYGGFAHRSDFW